MSHISVFIVDRLHETSLFLFFNMRKVQGGAGKVSVGRRGRYWWNVKTTYFNDEYWISTEEIEFLESHILWYYRKEFCCFCHIDSREMWKRKF